MQWYRQAAERLVTLPRWSYMDESDPWPERSRTYTGIAFGGPRYKSAIVLAADHSALTDLFSDVLGLAY
jgi:hypothetical protein